MVSHLAASYLSAAVLVSQNHFDNIIAQIAERRKKFLVSIKKSRN